MGLGNSRMLETQHLRVPPVLILRVGDFFHTKIIPDNLSISYDPLTFGDA
jgi:hypothetical protein